MNRIVAEWIEKAEGDHVSALRELRAARTQIMILPAFTLNNVLRNTSRGSSRHGNWPSRRRMT